ncbi:MAG: hypothetical protein LBV79_02230 [Candidatus Adiutrix sp.]|jgi:hypothetical protein|nr:hypothetical protein [Candidatus Adiutrix sp.]
MKSLSGKWSGRIEGTNIGNIFAEIVDIDGVLTGTLKLNDNTYGPATFEIKGRYQDSKIAMLLSPQELSKETPLSTPIEVNGVKYDVKHPGTVLFAPISIDGDITKEGTIQGTWRTQSPTAGVFSMTHSDYSTLLKEVTPNQVDANTAFIIMPIDGSDPSIQDTLATIKRATEKYSINAERVDEIEHSGKITDMIIEKIQKARFIICDITHERPNVYYELGYAHAYGKDVVIIAKEDTRIHFDCKDYNVILFRGFTNLQERLEARIKELINPSQG